ncbi:MAG: SdrD B-like domain-containing protein, partial [Bacteroidota bacterium]
ASRERSSALPRKFSWCGTTVTSGTITLSPGDEPEEDDGETAAGSEQDDAADANGNMTLDFGFFAPVSVGDTAFVDFDGDGLQTPGEEGIANVSVTVYDNATGMPVTTDADGNPYTNMTVTDADGHYEFTNLPPGEYYVVFDISTADNAEFYTYTTPNVDGDASDADDSDADPATGQTAPTDFLPSGTEDLSLDVGVVCNITVTVADPFTICSTQPIDLTQDAAITPSSLGGNWSTPDGNGAFTTGTSLATATTYVPGEADVQRGFVTLVLTTNDPDGPCEPVSAQVIIEILKVDCGSFLWDGSND